MSWSGEQRAFVIETHFKNGESVTATLRASGEAHFHLAGCVNKQNCRYWESENLRELHQKSLHSPKVTVWCALSSIGIIGPYFFQDGGVTVTVNSNRYCGMLENFLRPKIEELNEEHRWPWEILVSARWCRCLRAILQEMFLRQVVSLREPIQWPTHSPDLSPWDFFLWGYLKAEVFKHCPRTLEDLTTAIEEGVAQITPAILQKFGRKFYKRLNMCIARQCHHLNDIIFES